MKRLNPLNDYLFQKYMGEKGDEEQLLSFLNAVLSRTGKDRIASLEIIENKTLMADIMGGKKSILDVRAVMDDGTKVNTEVQLRNVGNMDRRSLFYWSREFSKSIVRSQDYEELPNVIAINIVGKEYIPLEDFHTTFHLWEDNHKEYLLTDALEIHFVDMVKFKRIQSKDIKNNSLHRWLSFFDEDTPEEILREVMKLETAIKKADEKIAYILNDPEALRAYEMRQMAILDYNSGMNAAERRGELREREKSQKVIEEQAAALAEKDAENAHLRSKLADLQAKLEDHL